MGEKDILRIVERVAKEVQGVFLPPRQLREVLSPAQGRDPQEDSIHGLDHPDEGSTEGYVRQLGNSAAAREG